jgi:hypothetical protein
VSTGLIIEPLRSGHHLAYLVQLVSQASARGVAVTVAVGDDTNGDEIATRLRSALPDAELSIVRVAFSFQEGAAPGPIGRLANAYRWWTFLARAYRAASAQRHIDFVFVPYLDFALWAISVLGTPFGDTPFGGITMAQRFHFHDMGVSTAAQKGVALRQRLFFRLLRTKGLRELFVIDETLEAFVRSKRPELGDKIRFVPDPSSPPHRVAKREARDRLKLRPDAALIVAYGSLDGRKDISTLLDWAAAADEGLDIEILLAGRVRPELQAVLEGSSARRLSSRQRLALLTRYIEDREEALIFSAADAIWVAYDSVDSMSGVLVKAALYEKAVLFRNYGLIGRYATRWGCPVSPASVGLPALPDDVQLCAFSRSASAAHGLPDHSWTNACDHIFGPGR